MAEPQVAVEAETAPLLSAVPKVNPGPVCPLTTNKLTDIVMQFAELYGEASKIHLHHYQRVFMRRIVQMVLDREGEVVTGLWSRQSGKSEALSSLAPALCIMLPALAREFPGDPRLSAFSEGFWMGIFAPKQQQATIIYERIRSRAEKPEAFEIYNDPDFNIRVTSSRGDQVTWSNGSFVTAQTASEHSNVEGKTYHLVIIDEAQLVSKAKVHKEISPMLASTNGVLVEIGTANALRGNFRETIVYNLAQQAAGKRRNHFEFPYDVVIAQRRATYDRTGDEKHLNYERWVGTELHRLGGNIENEEFKQNFRLLWQESNLKAFDPDALSEAADTGSAIVTTLHNHRGRIVAGLDYGKKRDVTILTILWVDTDNPMADPRAQDAKEGEPGVYYQKRVLAWYAIPGRKWQDILGKVASILGCYDVDLVVSDGTGIGDPLTEQLQGLMPDVTVIPFVMSHVGNDRIYKLYIQEVEAGRMTYPADEATRETYEYRCFVHEHEELLKDRVGVYVKCYAPEGEHDDYCDSGGLACYAATLEPNRLPDVEVSDNSLYGSRRSGSSRADRYR